MSRMGLVAGLALAGMFARSVTRGAQGTALDNIERQHNQHVIEWWHHKRHLRWRAEREAELAARRAAQEASAAEKRKRDAQWIDAAEAKRQRKRAKALRAATPKETGNE
ncbi:MAG: hypothetical protein ACRCTG_14465 [Aestuariivirga sp.]